MNEVITIFLFSHLLSQLRQGEAFVIRRPLPVSAPSSIALPTLRGFKCSPSSSPSSPSSLFPLQMSTETSQQWWQSVELKDADLAKSVRKDFPILSQTVSQSSDGEANKPLIYFDSAATSQKPIQVIDEISSYYNTINSNVHRGAHTLSQKATAKYESARDSIAKFVNAKSRNEIVFTSGATEALNLIASTYGRQNIQKGDEIIITEFEHHSNIVPWQMLAEEKGAVLKYVPLDPETGCLDWKCLPQLLSERTKIVSVQHVSNVMANINPVDEVVALTRSLGAPDVKIILDACQSVPHMPVDVQKLGVDFIAASGHKMVGPTGIGFLWGREEILNEMPPYKGGGEMIDEVYMDHSTYAKAPARFEAGTPAIAQAIGLGKAVEYLEEIGGMERIYKYEKELASYLYERMSEVEGITLLGPKPDENRAAIVAFVCDNVHPSDLSTFLDMEGVAIRAGHHCCQPLHRALGYSHSARASLYFYNTKEEIDAFIDILKETLAFLGGNLSMDGEDDGFVPFI